MKTAKIVIPKRLSAPARAWVQGVISAFDLEPHHYRLLLNAADFWDEGELATTILRREGVTVLSAAGTAKAHPALAIARSSFRVARRSVAPCKSFAGQAVTTLAQPPPPSIFGEVQLAPVALVVCRPICRPNFQGKCVRLARKPRNAGYSVPRVMTGNAQKDGGSRFSKPPPSASRPRLREGNSIHCGRCPGNKP